ncbi:MAG: M18 family aminopeptidase [Lachnospiraceae bacterium]|nr:M18 family aminopeptidase [Lachnospiraceae bacterium]
MISNEQQKQKETAIRRLTRTLEASVSPYHCIQEAERQLSEAGFTPLALTKNWELAPNGRYYINAFDSTLLAFTLGSDMIPGRIAPEKKETVRLRLAAAHTDWPCLKLKPSPETATGRYGKLNVEVYGGPILSTWMDRPLSVAGKVCVMTDDPFAPEVLFINHEAPIFTIPSLAIHMNREVNKGVEYNPQVDMLPLAGILTDSLNKDSYFLDFLAKETGHPAEEILDYEIYLYNADKPAVLGLQNEFLSAPRLDNVTSVQACLTGLIEGGCQKGIQGIALYDNEEIGSCTKQGAESLLLERALEKIFLSLGLGREALLNSLMGGLMFSLDVAHAMHPNHPEKCDIKNQIIMGDGAALKLAASQAYATDASYSSIIEGLCRKNRIPYKKFSNRSDIRGGSTLGHISSAILNMPTIDAGVPMLAMHSAREIIHIDDQIALEALTAAFFCG